MRVLVQMSWETGRMLAVDADAVTALARELLDAAEESDRRVGMVLEDRGELLTTDVALDAAWDAAELIIDLRNHTVLVPAGPDFHRVDSLAMWADGELVAG